MIPTGGRGRAVRATWVEVDLDRLRHNVRTFGAHLAPAAGLLAVVKADAYGHGAVPVARAALEAGATALGVAILEEGQALRQAGVAAPVLVMGWTPAARAGEVVEAGLDQAVFSLEEAEAYGAAARARHRSVRLHAKLDTGMGRLGWPARRPGEQASAVEDIIRVARLPGVELAGVFTHFAGADEADLAGAQRQLEAFQAALAGLDAAGVRPRWRHCANTAATLRLPAAHFDLCRVGIGLYGYLPSPCVPDPGLQHVLAWHVRISQVRALRPGDGVSYNGIHVARQDETIATLPVGYADGLPRVLSDRGVLLHAGAPAVIAGRVCMDQTMIAVPAAQQGEVVTLVGEQGAAAQSADDLAAQCGTISYEILCGISPRVPRLYRGG